jgi:hypothetical protein
MSTNTVCEAFEPCSSCLSSHAYYISSTSQAFHAGKRIAKPTYLICTPCRPLIKAIDAKFSAWITRVAEARRLILNSSHIPLIEVDDDNGDGHGHGGHGKGGFEIDAGAVEGHFLGVDRSMGILRDRFDMFTPFEPRPFASTRMQAVWTMWSKREKQLRSDWKKAAARWDQEFLVASVGNTRAARAAAIELARELARGDHMWLGIFLDGLAGILKGVGGSYMGDGDLDLDDWDDNESTGPTGRTVWRE